MAELNSRERYVSIFSQTVDSKDSSIDAILANDAINRANQQMALFNISTDLQQYFDDLSSANYDLSGPNISDVLSQLSEVRALSQNVDNLKSTATDGLGDINQDPPDDGYYDTPSGVMAQYTLYIRGLTDVTDAIRWSYKGKDLRSVSFGGAVNAVGMADQAIGIGEEAKVDPINRPVNWANASIDDSLFNSASSLVFAPVLSDGDMIANTNAFVVSMTPLNVATVDAVSKMSPLIDKWMEAAPPYIPPVPPDPFPPPLIPDISKEDYDEMISLLSVARDNLTAMQTTIPPYTSGIDAPLKQGLDVLLNAVLIGEILSEAGIVHSGVENPKTCEATLDIKQIEGITCKGE